MPVSFCVPYVGRSATHSGGSADGGILGGTLLPFSSYVFTPAEQGRTPPRLFNPFLAPFRARLLRFLSFLAKNWYAVATMIPSLLKSSMESTTYL